MEVLKGDSLNQFINILLIYHLNSKTFKIINILCESNDMFFVKLVKTKLWYTLNEILNIKNKRISDGKFLMKQVKDEESFIEND